MGQQADPWEQSLEEFRTYLEVVAQVELDPRLQAKIDLAGIMQQTLLEAHTNGEQLRDWGKEPRARWLRKAFSHNLIDEIRRLRTRGRDVRRERSLEAALDQSSTRLEAYLSAHEASPSEKAQHQELELRLADALGKLREAERE